MLTVNDLNIAIVGLGYVGLPLAVEFGVDHKVVAFDVDKQRIAELRGGFDRTNEVSSSVLSCSPNIKFTSDEDDLANCNCYIVAVPTPVDDNKEPDLEALESASKLVGKNLDDGNIIVFESTVYPGMTEEFCAPILSSSSGLEPAADSPNGSGFYLGYSPERTNPGDKKHTIRSIVKITSGCCVYSANIVDELYKKVCDAGTFKAASIKVAEAAKIMENVQRDVNVALMNEFSVVFERLNISTIDVLQAAKTKWNFIDFKPGLVGGHCVGVDPYYLVHKAKKSGYDMRVVLASRAVNDGMAAFVSQKFKDDLIKNDTDTSKAKILLMGLTFKENCPDCRNSMSFELFHCLSSFAEQVDVFDPWVEDRALPLKVKRNLVSEVTDRCYDGIIIAVAHSGFKEKGESYYRSIVKEGGIIFDLKGLFEPGTFHYNL